MITLIVLLCFFTLMASSLFGKEKEFRFCSIITGMLFFPHIIAFQNSPYIAPQTLLLYLPLFFEYVHDTEGFSKAFKNFPLKIPLFIFAVTSFITAATTPGNFIKNMYDMFRYVFDNYAFFFLAYWFGLHIPAKKLLQALFIPLFLFCAFGFVEFLLNENLPYKYICSAFPIYQGIYDLSTSISISQSWRSRICITTHHPNTLTPMLFCFIYLLFPQLKKFSFKFKFLFLFLCSLVFIAGSRTGMICLIGFFGLYFFKKFSPAIKIAIVVTILLVGSYKVYSVINYFDSGNGSSISMRSQQFLYTAVLFLQKPITGNGTGYMGDNIFEVNAYGEKTLTNTSIGALESFLFRILIDFGLIGLFSQLLIIISLLFFFHKKSHLYTGTSGFFITASCYAFIFLAGDSVGTLRFMFLTIGFCLGNCKAASLPEEDATMEIEDQKDLFKNPDYLESDSNNANNLSDADESL